MKTRSILELKKRHISRIPVVAETSDIYTLIISKTYVYIFVCFIQFNGVYEFRYPIQELERYVPSLEGMEVQVTATVGERFLDEVIEAYSTARVFNSSVRINFLGGSPQIFKPAMPFTVYVSVAVNSLRDVPPVRVISTRGLTSTHCPYRSTTTILIRLTESSAFLAALKSRTTEKNNNF